MVYSLPSSVKDSKPIGLLSRTQPISKPYIRSLDSLRTIAALLVIFGHLVVPNITKKIGFFQHTGLAVDFFFVLSGFVIALNYWQISGTSKVWRYLRARFARIYPLHLLTLLLFLGLELVKWMGASKMSVAASSPAFSINSLGAFVLNLLLLNAHGLTQTVTFNVPSWSIGVEATCYFLFAAILLSTTSPTKRLILILCSVIANGILFDLFPQLHSTSFGVIRGLFGFSIGCTWWFCLRSTVLNEQTDLGVRSLPNPVKPGGINGLCVALITVGASAMFFQFDYPGIYMLALGVIGLCSINPCYPVIRTFDRIGQGWFGQVSYGVYLWHYLIIWISSRVLQLKYPSVWTDGLSIQCPEWVGNVTVICTIGLSLGVAYLSFKYFEDPWRKRLRPRPRNQSPETASILIVTGRVGDRSLPV